MHFHALLILLVQYIFFQNVNGDFGAITSIELNKLFTDVHNRLISERAAKSKPGEMNFRDTNPNPGFMNILNGFNHFSGSSMAVDQFAQTGVEVARQIIRTHRLTPRMIAPTQNLSKIKAPNRFCPFEKLPVCDPSYPYRTIDGSCNNLMNKWWGQADTPFKRWLPAQYGDRENLNEPRRSIDGSELPNPLDVSCLVHVDLPHFTESNFTQMLMQFGQFANHDSSLLSVSTGDDGEDADCSKCKVDNICRPLFYNTRSSCCTPRTEKACMNYVRSSATFPDVQCSIGQREQHNIQTSFIDGSHIYGTNQEEHESLRDREKGRGFLKAQNQDSGADLLPAHAENDLCIDFKPKHPCLMAGDNRVNQNPGLWGMHTLFLREHNKIAKILGDLNPQWEDETVYQETRRIIIAYLQHIIYAEWLPLIVGPRLINKYSLAPSFGKYFTGYDASRDPRAANEWSTAAQRFGHSLIRSQNSLVDSDFNSTSAVHLSSTFFRIHYAYSDEYGGIEAFLRGQLKDPLMKSDEFFTQDITKQLFETFDKQGKPSAFDLVAININRGRDHGITGYPRWREWTGQQPIRTWEEMKFFIPANTVDIFRRLYKFVDDVDLFSAGVAEFKEPGSLVGPTFAEMISRMYHDWKFGDRFWYETNQEPARFTPTQLKEISKITLARVLCDTMENTPKVQPRVFISSKIEGNNFTDCNLIPQVDFSAWKV